MLRTALVTGGLILAGISACLGASDALMPGHEMGASTLTAWQNYALPDISLLRESGQSVALAPELNDGRPVVMNFIYTTCETSCPLSSATFSLFDQRLGGERDKVHLVSISIDPEQDTPARLRAYAKKFHAGPEWQFYTGTLAASVAAQKAFGAYRGDKMSHSPLTLMRAAPGKAWLRIEGFVTPDQLLMHYHELFASL